jgi:hypothetical protein
MTAGTQQLTSNIGAIRATSIVAGETSGLGQRRALGGILSAN